MRNFNFYPILTGIFIMLGSLFTTLFGQNYFLISGITSPSAANGTYNYQGIYSGEKYWQNSLGYKVYRDNYGGVEYWNIDIDLNDDNDVYFYVENNTSIPPQSGYTSLSGTGNPVITFYPEINIQGNSVDIVDGDTSPSLSDHTDFGSANVTAQTVLRTFTIQNTGKAQLSITSVSITGTNSADFSITTSPANSVNAESSTTFVVTFNPIEVGNLKAIITVNNSDADESAYYFDIKAVGNALITFTDGSSFTPNIVGNTNQAIGCYILSSDATGANLNSSEIKLDGTRTGISNFRLWLSDDNVFNSSSDLQLGSVVVNDPGLGNSISFSGFSGAINTSSTYFFLTADVDVNATGSVSPVVVGNSNLSFTNASLSSTISNSALSSIGAVLPVELTFFTAKINGRKVFLTWETATEVNNYGFEIEASTGSTSSPTSSANDGALSWSKCGFVEGHGNSNSTNNYSFTDSPTGGSKFQYRLKLIDTDGKFEYSDIVEVEIAVPTKFELAQNYPNPFNPTTVINYSLKKESNVTLKIYNSLGEEVVVLVNKRQEAGRYNVTFNASKLSSGIYFYSIRTDDNTSVKKMILLK